VGFADFAAALDWCEQERRNLIAAIHLATDRRLPDLAWRMTSNLFGFFSGRRYIADWIDVLEAVEPGLDALDGVDDRRALPVINNGMAAAYSAAQRFEEAAYRAERAAVFFYDIGDRGGQGAALNNQGMVIARSGDPKRAIHVFRRAAEIFTELGDRRGLAIQLGNIGAAQVETGDPAAAVESLLAALELHRESGVRFHEGKTLANLADTYLKLDRIDDAGAVAEQALVVVRETGNRLDEGMVLDTLGIVSDRRGDRAEATGHWRASLAILREVGEPHAEEVERRMRGD
jgi:tetratricopeptide (TPR) repeat protein